MTEIMYHATTLILSAYLDLLSQFVEKGLKESTQSGRYVLHMWSSTIATDEMNVRKSNELQI
jgi:hypothetical protein